MRKYKFRAWDKVHQEMKEVAVINWVEKIVLLWNVHGSARVTVKRRFDQVILLRPTGLFDKNGVEIYGGDIVRIKGGRQHGVVAYNGKEFGLFDDKGIFYVGYKWEEWQRFEVIGNIHENPEATP